MATGSAPATTARAHEIQRDLSKGLVNRHIKNSAFTVLGCAYTGLRHIGTRRWSIVDASIALQNMVIAAWALGVGSCWIGDFRENRVRQLLSIPDKWKVVALISFGYPEEKPEAKKESALRR